MNNTLLVAKREFTQQLRSKSMIISTLVTFFVLVAGGFAYSFFAGDDDANAVPPHTTIAVTADQQDLTPILTESDRVQVEEYTGLADPADPDGTVDEAREFFEKNSNIGAIIFGDPAQILVNAEHEFSEFADQVARKAITDSALVDQFGDVSDEQAEAFNAASQPQVTVVSEQTVESMTGYFAGLITIILTYMTIIMGISVLATGVVEEKTSRVVEILLASIRPRELLLGKFLGIGAFILLMVTVMLVGGIIGLSVAGLLPQIDLLSFAPWILIWVILGYILFASITGGIAATISRQEEIGAVTGPLVMLTLVPFYLAMFLVPNNPDGTTVKVLSQVPFFAPFMMPMRQALGNVQWWELALAIGICLVTIPILAAIAGKIYSRSVLRTGERVKLLEALRSSN